MADAYPNYPPTIPYPQGGSVPPAPQPASGILGRVAQAARFVISGVGPSNWFGPMQPLQPFAPPDVKGRAFDYRTGINLNYRPRSTELIGFQKLRALAEGCAIIQIVMNRQKDLICAFDWQIKPREDMAGKRPSESTAKAAIAQITEFMRRPDKVHDFPQWLRILLEEVYVVDAPAIYRRPSRDGKGIWALEILSGDTIQPLLDYSGRTPQPPDPAYVQVLKGVPAADFSLDELFYYPKNPRAGRIYGNPPIQMIIAIAETFIGRQVSQLAYFTEGNIPDALITLGKMITTEQIETYQRFWDDQFSGNLLNRRHGWFAPEGSKVETLKQPPLKDEFDEWLVRVVCFAFSTSPLPFIKAPARGNQESQQEVAEEGGIATDMAYVKRVVDHIIAQDFGHPELEFDWSQDREFDPVAAATIDKEQVSTGQKTFNEIRDRLGLDPYPSAYGDRPIIITATGIVDLEQAMKDALAPPEPQPALVPPGAALGQGGAPPSASGETGGGVAPKAGEPKAAPAKPAAKPVQKLDARPFGLAKADGPLEPPSPKQRAATIRVRDATAKTLKAMAPDVRHQVHRALLTLGKAEGEDDTDETADKVVAGLDLSALDGLASSLDDPLASAAEDGGNDALLQIGVSDRSALVNQVATRAIGWAQNRAAELVGKKWVDGQLVDNPDAKWAITGSTRDMIRETITQGLRDNLDVGAIADSIEASYAFSADRAQTIAHTEIRRANSQGALGGAREARDAGVAVKKVWLGGQDPCEEICQPNIDQGAIDLDDEFDSGDDASPGHPGCFCSISWDLT